MKISDLLKKNRQMEQTTSLINAIRENKGQIIFGNIFAANYWKNEYPDLKDQLYTLSQILKGDIDKLKESPIYFDNTAILQMAQNYEDNNFTIAGTPIELDKNSTITWSNGGDVAISSSGHKHQINVKLNDEDVKQLEEINKDFFEGEATNSMLGRILLRKGVAFYNKLKASF